MTTQAPSELDLNAVREHLAGKGNRQYWRSLEELTATPRFQDFLHREFPRQASEWNDESGRRDFLKLMAASLALAGATGCTREPQETIVPYVRAPEQITFGKTLSYATAMPLAGYGLGLLATSNMGRPTKLEGNALHPASLGATDAYAQASILSLYDPDRSQTVLQRGAIDTWENFVAAMTTAVEGLKASHGAGLHILTPTVTSPTISDRLRRLLEAFPQARWRQYEPLSRHAARAGAQLAFGRYVDTTYRFDRAKIVLSLDSDFFVELPGSARYARHFIDGRRVHSETTSMNRLYVVETTPTITGATADHRLPMSPRGIEAFARKLAERLGVELGGAPSDSADAASVPGLSEKWFEAVVGDLRENRAAALVIAGERQSPAVHALVHSINAALDAVGQTVEYREPVESEPADQYQSIAELTRSLNAGSVQLLLMLGGNPVYDAPADLQFGAALDKAEMRVHLSGYDDETSHLCHWHIPEAHYLEAWGDIRAFDGTATIQQPLIAPLYSGRSAIELLSLFVEEAGRSAYEIIQQYWKERLGGDDFNATWRRAVHDGTVEDTAARLTTPALETINLPALRAADATSNRTLDVVFRQDASVYDGRFANNGWLQELPRPLSKLVWDNAALVAPATADRLNLKSGDVVELSHEGRTLRAPVLLSFGHAVDCITLTLGYGRNRAGRVGNGVGYNAYELLTSESPDVLNDVTVRKTGQSHTLVVTQDHHSMEGRDIVRVTTLEDVRAGHPYEHAPHQHEMISLYPEWSYEGDNSWGMSIDQTACIGCNACVVACQAENNIPVVGKEQVATGREMHWLRIDRYYKGELENPEPQFQPVMCQHCEQAPCEVVCPVAATVHSAEGLNEMVYNRCVGTRYCSNNCPYKVRRFNFLQYSDQTTPSLMLLNNPQVSVRSRGVMEKCTYCVQRISAARIDAKKDGVAGRPVADGEVVTACQAACPTRAIVFGNLNDTNSQVRKLKQSPLDYSLLAGLNTQPRTTYLGRVRNPHPLLAEPSQSDLPQDNISQGVQTHDIQGVRTYDIQGVQKHDAP